MPYAEGHPQAFRREDCGLHAVPRVATHAGFIFASIHPDVPPLAQHLGAAAQFMTDFMVNRTEILGIQETELPQYLQLYRRQLRERLGEARTAEVLRHNGGDGYNLLVYPNLFLIGVQIRTIQPISVDTTEVYCAPTLLEGARARSNEARLRARVDAFLVHEPRCWTSAATPSGSSCSRRTASTGCRPTATTVTPKPMSS